MEIHLSPNDGVPTYRQIVRQVKYLVASGRLRPGEELPPIRVLAERLTINPNTVARAYRELEQEGVVTKRSTTGTYVSDAGSPLAREECLKILALYAPTAKDLRYVVGIFKITNDLERVGDLAVNIAERALSREGREDREGLAELGAMSEACGAMLRGALDAFVKQDRRKAEEVLKMDDQVDDLLVKTYEQQREIMENGRGDVRGGLLILSVAKNLERIADHCTNVAEDVIYMVAGDLVRHTH